MIAAALIVAGMYSEKSSGSGKAAATPLRKIQAHLRAQTAGLRQGLGRHFRGSAARVLKDTSPDQSLFGLAIGVYLLVMLIGLDRFPVYFFTDEAINTMLASDFLRDGFRDYAGQLFPVFFKNYDKYSLSTSVYLQVIPAAIFQRSVLITRGTAVLATLLAAIFISLTLRNIYHSSAWWTGPLILAATPAWLLHGRTAFETTLMASFYAAALYFYLRYRTGFQKNLVWAVLFGALTFYTYTPARVILPLTALALFALDFRYHWQHKRTLWIGLLVAGLCALPYLRFYLSHPGANWDQLYNQASYWFSSDPLSAKIGQYVRTYAQGLNPLYWYFPGDQDLARHRFDSLGHLWLPALPLLVLGAGYSLKRLHEPGHRVLWLAFILIPSGAALIDVGITRLMALIIPVVILQGFGATIVTEWLGKTRLNPQLAANVTFAVLCLANFGLLGSALISAPTWSEDYGLTGTQWGASQVFARINLAIEDHPGLKVVLSPTWANGTDTLARFFMSQDPPDVTLAGIDHYLNIHDKEIDSILFVLPEYEFNRAMSSGKFQAPEVIDVLDYPNKQPGFYFAHLTYVPEIDAILAAEQQERLQPETRQVDIDGQQVVVTYPRLDIGEIQQAFDGDSRSLCRTTAANPAIFDFQFPQPRRFAGIGLVFGSTQIEVSIRIPTAAGIDQFYRFRISGTANHPQGEVYFPEPATADQIHLEIVDLQQGQPGNVHFWEITFY